MALHLLAESALDDLLCCWRRHTDLQRLEAPVHQLAASRIDLDEARSRMARLREAMYPTDDELEDGWVATLCTALDQVVFLGWRHRHPVDPTTLVCICGEPVPRRPDPAR